MDSIIIIAAVILTVISIIELTKFFLAVPSKGTPAYISVLPVFADDEDLADRLEYLSMKSCGRKRIILVKYSSTPEQDMLCSHFIRNDTDAVMITPDELESCFADTFSVKKKLLP
jgi:hypothetical protein